MHWRFIALHGITRSRYIRQLIDQAMKQQPGERALAEDQSKNDEQPTYPSDEGLVV